MGDGQLEKVHNPRDEDRSDRSLCKPISRADRCTTNACASPDIHARERWKDQTERELSGPKFAIGMNEDTQRTSVANRHGKRAFCDIAHGATKRTGMPDEVIVEGRS